MFNVPDSKQNFYLTLIANANYEKVKELDKNKNVVILNPDLIIDSFHIKLGINNAIYKINSGKTRTKMLKNAIIHYLTSENKLENSLKLHQITKKDKNFYIIFIDFSKEDIDKEINNLKLKKNLKSLRLKLIILKMDLKEQFIINYQLRI